MRKKKDDEKRVEDKKGVVESFLEGIPGFGKFFSELGKTEVFQKRFEDVNEQIEENLRKGDRRYVSVEGNISVRPLSIRPSMRSLVGAIKKETPEAELSVQKDYVYGKKGDKLILGVKVPKKDANASLTGRHVLIKGDNFQKKIELPAHFKKIEKKRYKKGILMLELEK
jgi:hypothetical protein